MTREECCHKTVLARCLDCPYTEYTTGQAQKPAPASPPAETLPSHASGAEAKRPKVYHLGAALQGIADTHAELLSPREKEALYQASSKLWDDAALAKPASAGGGVDVEAIARAICKGKGLNPDCQNQGAARDGTVDGHWDINSPFGRPYDNRWHYGWRNQVEAAKAVLVLLSSAPVQEDGS